MHVAQTAFGTSSLDIVEIARDYYDAIYRFCSRRVGVENACDVTQETFITAQGALKRYRGESSLITWLFGIAHNECRRFIRKSKVAPQLIEFDIPVHSGEGHWINRTCLEEALSNLSPDHREIVLLHEIEGLTYDEAALVLSVPVGTVKSRLHHAFLQLRKRLQDQEFREAV